MVDGNPFTAGGPVPNIKIYVRRAADDVLLENCLEGNYCVILTSRQMGKTSLINHTIDALKDYGVIGALVDLNRIGTGSVTASEWYHSFLSILIDTFKLKLNFEEWWKQRSDDSFNIRFSKFIEHVLLQEIKQRIVIFVDEIEMTGQLEEGVSDSFFAAIRSFRSARGTNDVFERISFVLVGMAEISNLIRQHDITTYNIARRIELTSFTAEEIIPLVETIPSSVIAEDLCDWIVGWTGGQPFITQLLCVRLSKSKSPINGKKMVDTLVEELVSENDHDLNSMHVATVARSITTTARAPALLMLGVYALILDNEIVLDTEQSVVVRSIKLFGLVKSDAGILKVSNNIYLRIFNQTWIEMQLRKLKGYAGLQQTVADAIEHLSQYAAFSATPNEKVHNRDENIAPKIVETQASSPLKIQYEERPREIESEKGESPVSEKLETNESHQESSHVDPEDTPAAFEKRLSADFEFSDDEQVSSDEEFEDEQSEEGTSTTQVLQRLLSRAWRGAIRPFATIALRSVLWIVMTVAVLIGGVLFAAVVLGLYIHSLSSLLISGGILLVILFVLGTVVSIQSERSLVEERLGRYLSLEDDVVENSQESRWRSNVVLSTAQARSRFIAFLGMISVTVIAVAIMYLGSLFGSNFSTAIGTWILLILNIVMGIVLVVHRKTSLLDTRFGRFSEFDQRNISGRKEGPLQRLLQRDQSQVVASTTLADELAQASISLRPLEYLSFMIMLGSFTSLMFGFLFDFNSLAVSIGGLLGVFAPRIYLIRRKELRIQAFESQLTGALNLIRNGLRAGYSANQTIEAVSNELYPPISDEFRRVVRDMQVGFPIERAMENMLLRVPSLNLNLVITSMIMQREVGGSLSEVLDNILNRIRSYNQSILQSKRLGLPTFDFIYIFSVVVMLIHFLIFPTILGRLENIVATQPALLMILVAWSFVILLMGMIKNRREHLLDQIHRAKQVSYTILIDALLLFLAYLVGVPELLIVWLIVLYFSQYAALWYVITGIWTITVGSYLLSVNAIPPSFQAARIEDISRFIAGISGFLSPYIPANPRLSDQLISIDPVVGWAMLAVIIILLSVLLVLAELRYLKDGNTMDLMIEEYMQRADLMAYSEVDLQRPLVERVFLVTLRKVGDFTQRFTPQFTCADLRVKLELAGNPLYNDPVLFLLSRFFLSFLFGSTVLVIRQILFNSDPYQSFALTGIAAFAGYFFPNILLQIGIVRRQDEIRNSFVFVLDILTLCTEAGLGFDAAMSQVADKWGDVVSRIFARTLKEIQLGKPRKEAMNEMARRIGIPELTHFLATVVQSDSSGISLAGLLRMQSDEMFFAQQEHVARELVKLDFYSKLLFILLFSLGVVLWVFIPLLLMI